MLKSVIIEIVSWNEKDIQAIVKKIEKDPRVLSVTTQGEAK